MLKAIYVISWIGVITVLSSQKGVKDTDSNNKNSYQRNTQGDSSILIKFEKSKIAFNWSNAKSEIIEDELYRNTLKNFKSQRNNLISQITDKSPTLAITCGKKSNLVMGDLAFLLIDKVEHLPFFEIAHVQCDVFNADCQYPYGYFGAIENHRTDIQNNVRTYLSSEK
jgi:hypothetical protein